MNQADIRSTLDFTHRSLMLAGEAYRAAQSLAEARAYYATLLDRHLMTQATSRGMPERAFTRYYHLYVDPAHRAAHEARTIAAQADRDRILAARAHDRAIEAASAYRGEQ